MPDEPLTPRWASGVRSSGPALVKRLARLGYRTQVAQAEALGLTQSSVSRMARGGSTPSGSVWRVVELLERVAELEAPGTILPALGVSRQSLTRKRRRIMDKPNRIGEETLPENEYRSDKEHEEWKKQNAGASRVEGKFPLPVEGSDLKRGRTSQSGREEGSDEDSKR
jgi:predicted transcriptional regulator